MKVKEMMTNEALSVVSGGISERCIAGVTALTLWGSTGGPAGAVSAAGAAALAFCK